MKTPPPVFVAAWLGWGLAIFDGTVLTDAPVLLGLTSESEKPFWWIPAVLVAWGFGGCLFGPAADWLGRRNTLLLTISLYGLGMAACAAFAFNIWALAFFAALAALGVGGEWGAGASLLAETFPEKRIRAGALLYTSSPAALLLVTVLRYGAGARADFWRVVFVISGLASAAVVLFIRRRVRESALWEAARGSSLRLGDLFAPPDPRTPISQRARTLSGLFIAVSTLIVWWSCHTMIRIAAGNLARESGDPVLGERWGAVALGCFSLGGLLGTLLTIPAAERLGRRKLFAIYQALSSLSLMAVFWLPLEPEQQHRLYFLIGIVVFGVFGTFPYYLPELFPTHLRGTGTGFTYNAGRFAAAAGSLAVIQAMQESRESVLLGISLVPPVISLLALPFFVETRHHNLD